MRASIPLSLAIAGAIIAHQVAIATLNGRVERNEKRIERVENIQQEIRRDLSFMTKDIAVIRQILEERTKRGPTD